MYNDLMDTPTLMLKAQRITSTDLGDGRYLLVAFRPLKSTLQTFSDAEGALAIVDLSDETGDWTNDQAFEITDVTISEDQRTMTVMLAS